MSELDDLERDLLAAADIWFDRHLHMKLQRLVAIARHGERAAAALDAVVARMPYPPKLNPPSDPVDQPVVPRSSPGGGAAEPIAPDFNGVYGA